ncbi:MAG: hypothetical protein PWK00_10100, partial [Coxiella burnetii]|nr:hypothetical protein [Coxiella burnetii]
MIISLPLEIFASWVWKKSCMTIWKVKLSLFLNYFI